ncbi:hypothetical protein [Zeimonas arvi]|uniref:DUF4238 domain-containing protein n=1 Tax=Zeimonas arvi TaxID=2498847 RepID=A0A5C8NUK0_9BURK|nr:hypothetical protein [Zeimonas arvi]TXL64770.1 hypothetical protein FHP08_13620 [Zeimonas arvi]
MTEQESLHPLRPFLKNWLWAHGRVGTRYLDCATGEIGFDEGKKARFAAERQIHVSLAANADDAVLGPPAVHEAGLAQFLRAAQLDRPEAAGSVAEVQRAVQDCIDLGLACAYQPDAQRAWARYALEPMFDDEIRAAVVADIRRKYLGMRAQLALYDFTVFHGLPEPLLLSESPFIDWRVRARPPMPFVSMPLGPYCLLVGTPSNKTSRAGPVAWKSVVAMGPFKDHNRHIFETARLWLVATTDEQLAALQARFAPPESREPEADRG